MKTEKNSYLWLVTLLVCVICIGCSPDIEVITPEDDSTEQPDTLQVPGGDNSDENDNDEGGNVNDGTEDGGDQDEGSNTDASRPDYDTSITPWEGLMADDKEEDIIGSNNDFYHELNSFNNLVIVRYSGSTATVELTNNDILYHIDGAHVAIDFKTNAVTGVEIIAVGSTPNGSLKVYGDSKYLLSLYGVDITSLQGPAINSQCKKRLFISLGEGTTNRLTDCETYSEESYTIPGAVNEDRKGCLFSEGNIIISGNGTLVVDGLYKHAIVTDGCYYQRPGVTVAIKDAAKNGIHIKGDSDDNTGCYIRGGAIYASLSGTAGKGIKSDMDIVVAGGKIEVTTSGNGTYDSSEADTSSAAGLKADGSIYIEAGELSLISSGTGGKGISADTDINILGGDIKVVTSGTQYKYSSSLTSSPKGVKADGNINISGGKLTVSVTGRSEGSEGIESKATLTISGGETIIEAYDDAVNASTAIDITGGRLYAYASNNDGIDANGTLTMSGGLVIGVGSTAPESGVDIDISNNFRINGGTMIAMGGSLQSNPSTSSTQCSVVYGGITAAQGKTIAVLDSDSNILLAFDFPRSINGASMLFSSPNITKGSSYSVVTGGTVSDYTDYWQGWYADGSWSGGSTLTTFTASSIVTSLGSSSGGGPGGGPGGRP